MKGIRDWTLIAACLVCSCSGGDSPGSESVEPQPVGDTLSSARAVDGTYISWREHLIDHDEEAGSELRGSDGLVMADLDRDGYLDIVSVHESDTEYDGVPDGLIRIAFGSPDPDIWENVTLASGEEAAAPEDVAIADVNGDGYPDIVAACELAHLIYFENPGADIRTATWERVIPEVTDGRGSFIRVFFADLNRDGVPEVLSPNKGAQSPSRTQDPSAISWFEIRGPALASESWVEHELTRVVWPINAQPVDLDGDGDLDVIGGSVAEARIVVFENVGDPGGETTFIEHSVRISGTSLTGEQRPPNRRGDEGALISGFNMDFADLSGDGRLDIVTFEFARLIGRSVVWLEQPASFGGEWQLHEIGDYDPDEVVGIAVADVDGDGLSDVMTGGYSGGARDADTNLDSDVAAGRLAWYQNTGDARGLWIRHDISRRRRGMFDKFVPRDMDGDGDVDFVSTRGNSSVYDGVFWLEQVRTRDPLPAFARARTEDSPELILP